MIRIYKYCCKKCFHMWNSQRDFIFCPKCKSIDLDVQVEGELNEMKGELNEMMRCSVCGSATDFLAYNIMSCEEEITKTIINDVVRNTKKEWIGKDVIKLYICPKCKTIRAE